MSKETVSNILTLVLISVLTIVFAYMLRENTRLTVVNHQLESELVDSQNLSNEWSEDE